MTPLSSLSTPGRSPRFLCQLLMGTRGARPGPGRGLAEMCEEPRSSGSQLRLGTESGGCPSRTS